MWVHLRALYSVPLIYIPVILPTLYRSDYCSFMVSLDIDSVSVVAIGMRLGGLQPREWDRPRAPAALAGGCSYHVLPDDAG